jgi:hypothetical protein
MGKTLGIRGHISIQKIQHKIKHQELTCSPQNKKIKTKENGSE